MLKIDSNSSNQPRNWSVYYNALLSLQLNIIALIDYNNTNRTKMRFGSATKTGSKSRDRSRGSKTRIGHS